MNSVVLVVIGFAAFFLGYKFYSRYLGNQIYDINDEKTVLPSSLFEDGIDYIPTKKHILFGHHFTSIAGAAPIIGPCIAVFWGWLPAILWVVFGTIFMGAVHDFGSLVVSLKEKGKSDDIIRLAIKRMIPKGPLGKQQLSNCKIYRGPSHTHEAQNPVKLDISKLNNKNIAK